MRHTLPTFSALFLSALLLAPAAKAQDTGAAMDMTGMGIYAMEEAVKEAARETNPAVKRSVRNATSVRQKAARLSFTPSLERRRANLSRFVAATRATNPQAGADIQRVFASEDVIGAANKELVKIGLQPNNVADAYAAWWLNAWLASRGRQDTPPRAQIAAVRSQAVQALSNVPVLASANDANKQQLADACLAQAVIIGSVLEKFKGDPARLKVLATHVRQGARRMGLDLDAMELTNNGFQRSR